MSDELETTEPLLMESGDDLLKIAKDARRRVEAIKEIKAQALAVTNAQDWIDENGKPYLWGSGAEKIAVLFDITWRYDKPEMEVFHDGHFMYRYKGYFRRKNGREIEVPGSRSSSDPFFSKAHGRSIDPSEISQGDVEKAAFTNMVASGVTRALGLRNLTWEELAKAGITKGQSQTIDRASGPKAPNWGKFPKKPLTEVNDEWLVKYAETCQKQLNDPEREAYHETNKKLLQQLNAELDRRVDHSVTQAIEQHTEGKDAVPHE